MYAKMIGSEWKSQGTLVHKYDCKIKWFQKNYNQVVASEKYISFENVSKHVLNQKIKNISIL